MRGAEQEREGQTGKETEACGSGQNWKNLGHQFFTLKIGNLKGGSAFLPSFFYELSFEVMQQHSKYVTLTEYLNHTVVGNEQNSR